VPPTGGRQPVEVGLVVTNPTDKALLFNLFETLRPGLKSADGKPIAGVGIRKKTFVPAPLLAGPGKSETLLRQAHLGWQPDGKDLSLAVPDGAGGTWYFEGLTPGKWLLHFEYEDTNETLAFFLRQCPQWKEQPLAFWGGKVTTKDVEVEITPPPTEKGETKARGREGKAVRVNGVDFQAVMEGKIRVPATGDRRPVELGLRLRNASDGPLTFYNIARYTVALPDGTPLPMNRGADGKGNPSAFTVEPGKETLLPCYAALAWTPDGKVLQLTGQDNSGFFWSCDVKPGRYLLSAEYQLEKPADPDRPTWVGKVKTEAVPFEVLESRVGLKESKAVRVNGVDFQAVVEPKAPAPPPGGRQPLDLGLGVTNPGEGLLRFNLFDTLRPELQTADGKPLELAHQRLRSFVPLPMLAGPGKTETVLRHSNLEWLPGGKALRLKGPDGAGGTWHFDGLVPGKYLLRFEYASTREALDTFLRLKGWVEKRLSFWLGQVTTAEVEFEITPAP
jgi:hypothetical protein